MELEDKDLKLKTLENTLSKYQEKISDLVQKNYGLVQDRELQGESLCPLSPPCLNLGNPKRAPEKIIP